MWRRDENGTQVLNHNDVDRYTNDQVKEAKRRRCMVEYE